jgi:hypothetical protein
MSEKYLIIVSRPLVIKLKRIKIPRLLIIVSLEIVLVIFDVLSNPMPSDPLSVLDRIGIVEDFHSIVIERVRFCKINDIKLHFSVLSGITNSEEKPLGMTVCIDIILKHEIIFIVRNFDCSQ